MPVESTLAVGPAKGESHKIHKFNLSSDLCSILLKWTLCQKKFKSTLLTNNWPIIFYTSFVGKKFCLCLIGKGKKCFKSKGQQETSKHFLSSSSEKWDSKLEARWIKCKSVDTRVYSTPQALNTRDFSTPETIEKHLGHPLAGCYLTASSTKEHRHISLSLLAQVSDRGTALFGLFYIWL